MAGKCDPRPLKGIITPMVTPLLDRDTLDVKGLERLVEHILQGGVHGLFILGTTGEAQSLSYRLRFELIDRVCKQVAGRVPVLVGITDTAFVESVAVAHKAEQAGAKALVLAPPYFFPTGQQELLEYLEHLVKELSLPLYLYNMPTHTKFNFEPETILAASELNGICGLKDSSGMMVYFHKIQKKLKNRKDFALFVGPEELLGEALLLGADGGVNGGSNFYPELYVNLYNAAQANDWEKVKKLHDRIVDVSVAVYLVGRYGGSSYLKGVKCTLSCMGICNDFMAEPFHAFKEKERAELKKRLHDLGLLKK